MRTFQKALVTAILASVAGVAVYEAHQVAQLRIQNQALQQRQAPLAEQLRQSNQTNEAVAQELNMLREANNRLNHNNSELLQLRNEVTLLRRKQLEEQKNGNPSSATSAAVANSDDEPIEAGRNLGIAVARGDAGAFDKLSQMLAAERAAFSTNHFGVGDQQRIEEVRSQTFGPIFEAFKEIGNAANNGSQPALAALDLALRTPGLRDYAVQWLGGLAGNGDQGALEVLIHPDKYGVLLSSTINLLQPAADNGNQKAIDALAAVANNQDQKALWYMTAQSLTHAAATGNSVAIDALVNMSYSTNRMIMEAVADGLRGAAANQNEKAADALHAMGLQ